MELYIFIFHLLHIFIVAFSTEYKQISEKVGKYLIDGGKKGSSPRDVARKIYIIAESRKRKMQYVVGKSTEIVALSKILPDKMVRTIIKKTMMK